MTRYKDLDQLLASDDKNGSIIDLDNFIGKICDYGDDYTKLTEPQKIFYYNQNLEREINNGGFNQFFCNSSGDNTHETILSLKTIGAEKTATILQKAIEQFPNKTVPKDRVIRTEIVEKIEEFANEIWNLLDEEFFNYEDDLNSLNLEFVKKNKSEF